MKCMDCQGDELVFDMMIGDDCEVYEAQGLSE